MRTPRLTIGIPTYDDHEGLLFTAMSLALHQDLSDCEVLIVDNHPASDDGKATKNLVDAWLARGPAAPFRYVPAETPVGPGCTKDRTVQEAAGDAVLIIDSHILLAPDAIRRLKQFYADHPATLDLHTGPLLSNGAEVIATHFSDVWRGEMWGVWAQAWACPCGWTFDCREHQPRPGVTPPPPATAYYDLVAQGRVVDRCPRCGKGLPGCHWYQHDQVLDAAEFAKLGRDVDDKAFEIPAMGMGLFSCRREAWLGFAPGIQGFGAEEFCIHGRYRAHGHKTVNLPFLRWWHRFARKAVPYPLTRHNKIRNYVLEFRNLGWDLAPIYDHFVATGLYGQAEWDRLIADPLAAVDALQQKQGCGGCGAKPAPIPDTVTLENLYIQARDTPSDINQHVPKLRELASQCDTIVEFGHRRGVSTVALLAGQPKKLRSYDVNEDPIWREQQKRQGKTDFEFIRANVLEIDIDECDLLFEDTTHTAGHVGAVLAKHAAKVRRWLAFHDTALFGERGENGQPGILIAIRKFLREHPEWSVIYHSRENNGFTVLSRDPRDKPPLPSLPRMAVNFAKAIAAHLAAGAPAATEDVFNARTDTCMLCDQRADDFRCSVCGCYIEPKASFAISECPLGRWLS